MITGGLFSEIRLDYQSEITRPHDISSDAISSDIRTNILHFSLQKV